MIKKENLTIINNIFAPISLVSCPVALILIICLAFIRGEHIPLYLWVETFAIFGSGTFAGFWWCYYRMGWFRKETEND